MATFVHFDISAKNFEKAKFFYENIFGWKFQQIPSMPNYQLISTTDLNGNESIGGGMAKSEDDEREIINYIGVESIDDTTRKIKEMGGTILQSKTPIPGWGYSALCTDTEKNKFGLFQEDNKAV